MTDIVTLCDVIDNCTDCPRYGDDCDGDKMTEHTDLISRADAIKAVMKHHDGGLNQINYGLTLARCELQSLPSADAVQGEWIEHELWGNPWYTCSICNYHGRNDFNYCPSCGTRMKGGDDE